MTKADQLPAELACSVFELLCFADRIRITHVCKHWRSVSLAHGWLWSRIRCSGARFLEARLERARRVPVDLEVIHITEENLENVLEILSRHLDHIRLLQLHANPWSSLRTDLFPTVYNALAHPAPLMEALDVQLFHDPIFPNDRPHPVILADDFDLHPNGRVVPEDLFLGHAPALRKFAFAGMRLPRDGPSTVSAMQNIFRLHLDTRRLSAVQLSAIVSLPRLRALYLEIFYCEVPRVPAPELFRLDELWILGPYDTPYFGPLCPLLNYLGFRHIRHFTADQELEGLDILSSGPRCRPRSLLVEEWSVAWIDENRNIPTQAWRMIDESGFVSDLLDIHVGDHFSWPDAQHMLSHLKELVIPYSHLRFSADYNPSFDHMTRLCVRMDPYDHADESNFRLPCPVLRTLELWGGHEGARYVPDVLVDKILDFVQKFLDLDATRPPELILRDMDATAEWTRLGGLVSGIRHEDPAPEPFVVELRSKWHVAVSNL